MPSMKRSAADSINSFVFASNPEANESKSDEPKADDSEASKPVIIETKHINPEANKLENSAELLLPDDLGELPEPHTLH